MTTGLTNDPDSLQDLRYKYDKVGNVKVITDTVALGGPQIQTFTYDTLDRLVTAQASGGTGGTYGQDTYQYDGTTGNLSSKAGVNYTYSAQATCNGVQRNIVHAVSAAGSNNYAYDCNGNMVTRNVGSTYNLSYDAESRLTSVSGNTSASFVYDGDGNRVKGTVAGTTTAYVGNYFEWTGSTSTMKRYYYAGGQRIAVREGSGYQLTGLSWLVGDHLGSTSITANNTGGRAGELRYKAWGEVRYTYGTTPTTYRYTGQRQEQQLGGSEGLYYYNARWYDPALGRFAQADAMVGGDRYAYVNNNPVNYTDPSGHIAKDCDGMGNCEVDPDWQKDKGGDEGKCNSTTNIIVTDDGKVCKLVPVTLHVTWYYTPDVSDYKDKGYEMVTVYIPGLGDIAIPKVLIEGEAGLKMQGTIKIGENQYIIGVTQLGYRTPICGGR